jgi:hypothetical protein
VNWKNLTSHKNMFLIEFLQMQLTQFTIVKITQQLIVAYYFGAQESKLIQLNSLQLYIIVYDVHNQL